MKENISAIGDCFSFFLKNPLPPEFRKQYIANVLTDITHASTAIEGNTLTEKQVGDVLDGKSVIALEKDVREVQNYGQVIAYIQTFLGNSVSHITEEIVRQMHAIIMSSIHDDIAGVYRTIPVHVGNYIPPDSQHIPDLMKEYVFWINKSELHTISPFISAGIVHYQFVAIHPFVDGNGRTARALTKLFLMCMGFDITSYFSLETFYNRDRKAYYAALDSADIHRFQGKPDLTNWLDYFLNGMRIESERAKAEIEVLLRTKRDSVWLTADQKTILSYVQKHSIAKMQDFLTISKLSRSGVAYAIQGLLKSGLIAKKGTGKATVYILEQ